MSETGSHQLVQASPSALSFIGRRRQLAQLRLQTIEIDRLGYELESTEFVRPAAPVVVAISCHHHYRQVRETLLDRFEELQSVHARHVDVGEENDQGRFYPIAQLA